MSAQSETSAPVFDIVKLGLAIALILFGIGAFYYFSDQSLLYRVLGLVAIACLAIAVAFRTEQGRTLWGFMRLTRTEVQKMVWPTRQETVQMTLIVVLMVLVVGILLWLLDMLLFWLVRLLTGAG